MDGEWIARGDSSGFQSDAVRLPPDVAPARPGGNQMNDNLSQFYHPFGREEKHPTNIVIAQDSTFLTKINLVHSEPCNPEANHLFLSGSSNHSQFRSSQLPNSMHEFPVTDPSASDFSVTVRSLSSGPSSFTYPRAVDLVDCNGRRMGIESNDPFTVSSQQSKSNNQSFALPESIEASHSLFSPFNTCNRGGYKTFHGNGSVAGVPSTLNLHNTGFIHAGVNPLSYSNAQITSNNTSEMKFIASDHVSAYNLGAPRVFCMGTVGEIFLNEKGFFGVICLCHSLRMPVAKFCEHSGSPPFVNPGDVVRLDNGQTIAQWRRLFFWNAGMRITDDNIGWDWPDCTITPSNLIGSKINNRKYPMIHESSHPLKLSGGSVRHGIIMKNSTSLAQSNMGHPAFEKLHNRTSDNVFQKSAMFKENSLYKGSSGSSLKSSDCLKETDCYNSLLISKPVMNGGKQNASWQFLARQTETDGKDGNLSVSNADLLSREPSASSNFELSLRQPSHQTGNVMSTTAHGQLFNLERQHIHEIPRSSVFSETRQNQQNLQYDHSEKLESRRSILQYESSSDRNPTEKGVFNGDLDKDSSISLFLSYLNTFEGNASIQASDGFLSSTENNVSRMPNFDALCSEDKINDGVNRSLDVNETDASYLVNRGKGVIISTHDGSFPLLRPDSGQNKRMEITKKSTVGAEEYSLQGSSRMLPTDTDTRNYNQSGESFCTKNCKECKDLECSTRCRTGFLPPRDLLLDLVQTPNIIPIPRKRIPDTNHCMLDGNMGFLSQKDTTELSHSNYTESSSDKDPHQRNIYCPLDRQMQNIGLKEDLMSQDKWRHGYCYFQRGSSESMVIPFPHRCHCTASVQKPPDKNVLNESCYDAISTSRIPFCSRGHTVQHNYCCCVSADESHPLRCCRIHNGKNQKNNKCGNRTCNKLPECFLGCCYSLGIRHSDACRKHTVCGSTETPHSPHLTRDCLNQDASKQSGCNGFRSILPQNKDNFTLWRDVPVPGNTKQDSYIINSFKPEEKLQVPDIVEDQDNDASTELANEASLELEIKERQMSNCCSVLPALPAEVSNEFTDTNSYNSGISSGQIVHDLVDEGSGIEKCGSSEVSLDTKVNSLEQSYSPTKVLNTGCSSKYKFFRRHLQSWKTRKAKNRNMLSKRLKKFDASNLDSVLSPIHYELSSCTDQPELRSSTFKEKESPLHRDDGMKTVSVLDSKASSFKRKGSFLARDNVSSKKTCTNCDKLADFDHLQLATNFCKNKICKNFMKKSNKAFPEDSNISSFKGVIGRTNNIRQTKYISLNDMKLSFNGSEKYTKMLKPVVCGNSGIISNGDCSLLRPVKMFSLRSILKNTRKLSTLEKKQECDLTLKSKTKKTSHNTNIDKYEEDAILEDNEDKDLIRSSRMTRIDNIYFSVRKESVNECSMLDTKQNIGRDIRLKSGIHHRFTNLKSKHRPKEIRKRSLDELIGKVNNLCTTSIAGKCRNLPKYASSEICQEDHRNDVFQLDTGKFSCKGYRSQSSIFNSDAFCCVCGRSNKDDTNHMIECSQCFIKVHQACYGILRVPKGYWYCRPCRANSIKTACVLCGYEGGAMTRAVKCQAIVRSILKAWKFETSSKLVKSVLSIKDAGDDDICISSSDKTSLCNENQEMIDIEIPSKIISTTDTPNVQNSIISGAFDPSISQWVHMVCGLWTPGTRCPNVDTMSTFDVSGALISRKNSVCSICNRPGGSCIKCRVVGCCVYFHPWCAHQKKIRDALLIHRKK